jgi:hypothetical protein
MIQAPDETRLSAGERLVQLLDHLGIDRAHFCTRGTEELAGLLRIAPERVASVTVQGAGPLPNWEGTAGRTLAVLGDQGRPAASGRGRPYEIRWLRDYESLGWSDTAADRRAELAIALLEFFDRVEQQQPLARLRLNARGEGEIAGISYRAFGAGTPVVLLPLGLARHQWDPVLPLMQARHTCLVLSGPHFRAPAQ